MNGRTFSEILMGRLVKVTPLQKLSARRATAPSRETRMFSPWTWWKSTGGKLLVPAWPPELRGAVTEHHRLLEKCRWIHFFINIICYSCCWCPAPQPSSNCLINGYLYTQNKRWSNLLSIIQVVVAYPTTIVKYTTFYICGVVMRDSVVCYHLAA